MDSGVIDAIDLLADTLKRTPEWEAWENAKAHADDDRELRSLRARVQELAGRWQRARDSGRALAGSEALELAGLQERLKANGLFLRQQDAGRQLVALLQETNDVMTPMLGLDFAANAIRRSGGCCG